MPYDIAFVRCSSTASSTSSTSSPTKSATTAPLAEEKKPVGTAVAVARGGVTCPAALVSADDKTYYSYAAQMSYAAYQALNP